MKYSILFFLTILIFSCTKEIDKPQSRNRIEKPEVGFFAPDFSMLSLDGKKISLSDITSDIIVLNFWFTGCPPCIEELPHLKALQENNNPEKLRVILLAADSQKNVERFINNLYRAPLVALDIDDAAKKYHVEKFPETFILNKKRIIIDKYEGYQAWSSPQLNKYFQSLFAQ